MTTLSIIGAVLESLEEVSVQQTISHLEVADIVHYNTSHDLWFNHTPIHNNLECLSS
jgi:hypothetical protein